MIPKSWKIMVGIEDEKCDVFYDDPCREYEFPFIPRIGEILWTSSRWDAAMVKKMSRCWDKNRCADCPFRNNADNDFDTSSYVYVASVKYNVNKKEITITLSNETTD